MAVEGLTPKVSAYSMSVWQDAKNPNLWNWSVHQGTQVKARGNAADYNVAASAARDELGKVLK